MDISGIGNSIANINNSSYDTSKNKATDDDFETKLKAAMNSKDAQQLKSVCKDFESILLNMMYQEMKATVPKSDILPEDAGTDIYNSMMDEDLMDKVAQGPGIGLADMMYKQLSARLESTYKIDDGGDSGVVQKK